MNIDFYSHEKYINNQEMYCIMTALHGTNDPHCHDFIELAYVLDGKCTHVLNGTSTTLTKGDYVIIDYNSIHNYICHDEDDYLTLINCLFFPEFLDRSLVNCNSFKNILSSYQLGINFDSLNFNPTEYVFHDTKGFIKQLLRLMLDEFSSQQVCSHEISRNALSQIILLTLREFVREEQVSDVIQHVIDACKDRYNEKKLLDTLCKEFHYSKPYISTKFKKEIGKSFKDYLIEIRMNTACNLLIGTNKQVSEISSLVGYSDVAFFIATFKEKTQLTPMQFRNNAKSPQTLTAHTPTLK